MCQKRSWIERNVTVLVLPVFGSLEVVQGRDGKAHDTVLKYKKAMDTRNHLPKEQLD